MPFTLKVKEDDLANNTSFKNANGDHHCTELVRQTTGAPFTDNWKPGIQVMKAPPGAIRKGSAIATFVNGRYNGGDRKHAAIYISHDNKGILVYDQWKSQAMTKQRKIETRANFVENPDNYFVIETK